MGYIKGKERGQSVLFPSTVDEYIAENNAVRAIAAFLGRLDFVKLGFCARAGSGDGQARVRSALTNGIISLGTPEWDSLIAQLEQESHRNLEVIWLCENLRPDFKTIADFRKGNGEGIKGVVVEFRLWCMAAGLYGKEVVAVDGSKFKAVNSKSETSPGAS
jgi:transposase